MGVDKRRGRGIFEKFSDEDNPAHKRGTCGNQKKSGQMAQAGEKSKMNGEVEFDIDIEYYGDIEDFDCGFEVFNSYLKYKFLDDKAAIHYVTNTENDNLIAYFSLLASCIFLSDFGDSNIIPAIELKMFAVDKKYRRLNVSGKLLEAIYDLVVDYSHYVGAKALILYSVPAEKVVQMYEKSGFRIMPENFSMYRSNFNDGCVPMFKFIE